MNIKGIEVVVPFGAEKWDKSGFSIRNEEGEPLWLHLFEDEATFTIHRNVVSNDEWEVFLDAE